MAKKIYVLDTSVYLTDANSINAYGNNDIVIPLKVLEEIDKHKKRQDGVGANARSIIRTLDELRGRGNLKTGVRIAKFPIPLITMLGGVLYPDPPLVTKTS